MLKHNLNVIFADIVGHQCVHVVPFIYRSQTKAVLFFYDSTHNNVNIVIQRFIHCGISVRLDDSEQNDQWRSCLLFFIILDEICRVMKNLALTIFEQFFLASIETIQWDISHNGSEPVRRLYQRKGNMNAQHNSSLCEACHEGFCYL